MPTSNLLVLVPLEESEIDLLRAVQILFFTGRHHLDGVPGTRSLRNDDVLGVRLELGPDEEVTIDDVPTRGTVDLVANEAVVRIDADRTVGILIDIQNGELKVAAFVTDRSSPLVGAAAGVLAYPIDPWWRRPSTFVADPGPEVRFSCGGLNFEIEAAGYTDMAEVRDRTNLESVYVRSPGGPCFELVVTHEKAGGPAIHPDPDDTSGASNHTRPAGPDTGLVALRRLLL